VLVIIIGLVLLIVAAVFGLDLIWKNHYTIRSPALFGQPLGIRNAAELVIIGAIAGAILLLGISMMPACAARAPKPSGTAPTARKPGTQAATTTRPRKKTKSSAVGSTMTPTLIPPAPPPSARSRGTQVRTRSRS
jgi:hypothetical protein